MRVLEQSSGATIVVASDLAYKTAVDPKAIARLRKQAEWLLERHHGAFPHVFGITSNGYVMERLNEVPFRIMYLGAVLDEMLRLLKFYAWSSKPAQTFDWSDHAAYVMSKLNVISDVNLREEFFELQYRADLLGLEQCEIHGDPTIDNLLVRPNGDMVIADPIPAYPSMPGVRASDVGKIMQSLYGFEAIKNQKIERRTDLLPHVLSTLEPKEQIAAYYFCAVHYLRLIPYHTKFTDEYVEVFINVVRDGIRL